jgi:hypothetical protein
MSWNAIAFKFRGGCPADITAVREDDLVPLGSADDIRDRVSSALPSVDWTSPRFGHLSGDGFGMEFTIPDKEPVEHLSLRVVGGGDIVGTILSFATPAGWDVVDISTGDFLAATPQGTDGWRKFQAYRDRVLTRGGPAGEG